MSGFPCGGSCYDVFDTGHASNSISVAVVSPRPTRSSKADSAIAVIGDGSSPGAWH
jgi:deoxyxylulose-5-phosphate synthase